MKVNGSSWLSLPLADSLTVYKNRSASEKHLVRKIGENNDNLLMNDQGKPFISNVLIPCTHLLSEGKGLKESKRSRPTHM